MSFLKRKKKGEKIIQSYEVIIPQYVFNELQETSALILGDLTPSVCSCFSLTSR